MNDFPQKINNSYESGSNSSSTGSSTTDQVLQFDEMERPNMAAFMASAEELYNTSAEEGIFPNVMGHQPNVPSYIPNYEYEYDIDLNDYNSAPLIYSWLPIVSGFTEDGVGNLHKFTHLNVSGSSEGSASISNQNVKYREHLVINSSADVSKPEFRDLDNSCNAMDLNISCVEEPPVDPDLSFNGKIAEIKAQETEEERLHNESFEILKKEDSTRMSYINERSPDMFEDIDDAETDVEVPEPEPEPEIIKECETAASGECDSLILKKLRSSLAGLCPPPSVTEFQLSLSEMLDTYKKNVGQRPPEKTIKNNSFFVPTHTPAEVKEMEWPRLMTVKCVDVAYNKSTDNEHIEELCGKYAERYIGSETATSFNLRVSAASAKKKIEKLKLQTQSPGRRLSHLAKRRTVFSSANLKSSGLASQSSSGGHLFIDKKLLAKASKAKSPKKRTSAKKKTPGKKKTPRSAKRQAVAAAAHQDSSRVSSKRALFTSPLDSKPSTSFSVAQAPKEVPQHSKLPRRTLFSPDDQKKRKRSPSPDHDAENRCGKQMRVHSPTRLHKSQSFSLAPTTSRAETFRKQLFQRTQSEAVIPGSDGGSSKTKLGYTEHPMPPVVKKKILWSVSNALTSKKISNDHEKFKEYASNLTRLVKNIFIEFYNPANKSISDQLMKFANQMVFFVIQGQDYAEIYKTTRLSLMAKNATKLSGYVSQQEFEARRSSSFLYSQSLSSSLNLSDSSLNSSRLSNSSLNRSSSKNNDSTALRENFMTSVEKSARKFGSDSNINRPPSSASTSNLLKAKRQISF